MFVIMALIISLRIRKVIQGTKVNAKKTIIFSVYFIVIPSYIVPYLAIAVTAVYCSYMYSKSALSFWKLPTTSNNNNKSNSAITYSKGGLSNKGEQTMERCGFL